MKNVIGKLVLSLGLILAASSSAFASNEVENISDYLGFSSGSESNVVHMQKVSIPRISGDVTSAINMCYESND